MGSRVGQQSETGGRALGDDLARPSAFALTGRSPPRDAGQPVRGDLAHIRLAGVVFVPHYAVPMPHRAASQGAVLVSAVRDGAPLARLAHGDRFDVLDMAGGWCWGETGFGGVGYIRHAELIACGI